MVVHGEKVRVAAVFEPGKRIRPVWFERHRRQHKVVETTYSWRDQVGDTTLVHFTVSDGEATLKRFYRERDGRIRLQAENPGFAPIMIVAGEAETVVIGKLLRTVRSYE